MLKLKSVRGRIVQGVPLLVAHFLVWPLVFAGNSALADMQIGSASEVGSSPHRGVGLIPGLAVVGVLGARSMDTSAQSYFSENQRLGRSRWFGDHVMGNGFPNLLLGGGMWAYGAFKDHPHEKHAGLAQMETVLATGLTVSLLKSVSNRRRPDGSDQYSFPSAHVAYAFSTASVLGEFYGPTVGIPAYGLAVLTAVGRMEGNRHWLSDTVGGAAIGMLFGFTFSRLHLKKAAQEKKQQKSVLKVSPTVGPQGTGLSFTSEF